LSQVVGRKPGIDGLDDFIVSARAPGTFRLSSDLSMKLSGKFTRKGKCSKGSYNAGCRVYQDYSQKRMFTVGNSRELAVFFRNEPH
jgi:hypothetical protein